MMAFEQLESTWPVHGSVLVQNDVLHCVAGRSAFTDGGMRLLRLDPMTGEKLGEVISNELDPKTGETRQDFAEKMRMPGTTLPDVLSGDGANVFMRDAPVDFGQQPSTSADDTAEPVPTIKRRLGFLDDTWLNRAGWSSGTRGWPSFTRICVFDDSGMYGFGYNRQWLQLKPFEHHLFAFNPKRTPRPSADQKAKAQPPKAPVPKGKKKPRQKPAYVWSRPDLPLLVRAMAIAGETLFVAGPPDHGLAEDAQSYLKHRSPEVQEKAQQQADALAGKQGGLLWAVAKADGKRLAEHKLNSPPVFDGMAAAGGRLYVCTMDGAVHCLGDRQ
jgi:pyruvate/2-oxoglutarate dehydrogenase complex dihydrolipoamide acyltransferase (E2) component